MNQRQFASVLFAVVGVFIAITWIPQIFVAIALFAQQGKLTANDQVNAVYPSALLAGTLTAILLGVALVVWRERLATRLFAAETGPIAARDTQAVALSVLGCYFAIGAIPRLVGAFRLERIEWPALTELVLGIALFFGARGLARLWTAARTAGSYSSDERAV